MPEIAEVARAVHYIRNRLVGKTLTKVTAVEDGNVFGKVGTSHTEIMKHLTGKKVIDAGQQGKYFWIIMSSPPHPVIHFGMAGWLKFKSEHTYYYRKKDGEPEEQWPPKYWKFLLETDGTPDEKVEAAYVDLRRFGRVRLVDCPAKDIRKHSPLIENGPDPVQDKDQVTVKWLKDLCQKKKVPIKAMLLDQASISGIGNWVGDEIMYNARMHPEQYANTLSDDQIVQLHKSIHYVCTTAVDLLADSDQFPEDWLFKHRWGKGKKDAAKTMPNGEKIVFLTVGGRTSAVVPSLQRKTGPVAKEMSEAEEDEKPKKTKKTKQEANNETADEPELILNKSNRGSKRVKEELDEDEKPEPKKRGRIEVAEMISKSNGHSKGQVQPLATDKQTTATNKSSVSKKTTTKKISTVAEKDKIAKQPPKVKQEADEGRRRSARPRA